MAWVLLDAYAAWYAAAHIAPSLHVAPLHSVGTESPLWLEALGLGAPDAAFLAVSLLAATTAASVQFAACWAWHRPDVRRSPWTIVRALAVGGSPRLLFLALPVWRYPVVLVLAVLAATASLAGEATCQVVHTKRAFFMRVLVASCAVGQAATARLAVDAA